MAQHRAPPEQPPEWLPPRSNSPFARPELQQVTKDTQLGMDYNDSLAERLSRSLTAASKRGQRLTARLTGRPPRAGSLSVSVPSTAPSTQYSASSSGIDLQQEEEGPHSPLQAGLRKLQHNRRSPGLARPLAAPAAASVQQPLYNPTSTSSQPPPWAPASAAAGATGTSMGSYSRNGATPPLQPSAACDSPTATWVAASSDKPGQPRLATRPVSAAAAEEAALYHQLAVQSAEGRYAEARVLADLARQTAESAQQEVALLSRLSPVSPAVAAPVAGPSSRPYQPWAAPATTSSSSTSSSSSTPSRQPSTRPAAAPAPAPAWGALSARPGSGAGRLHSHRLPTLPEEGEERSRWGTTEGGIVFPAAAAGSSVRAAAADYEQQVWAHQQQQQRGGGQGGTGAASCNRKRWSVPVDAAGGGSNLANPSAARAGQRVPQGAPDAAAPSSTAYPPLPPRWATPPARHEYDTMVSGARRDTAPAPLAPPKRAPAAAAAAGGRGHPWHQQQQQYESKYYPSLDSIPAPGVNTASVTVPTYQYVSQGVLLVQASSTTAAHKAGSFPAASVAHYDADIPPLPDRWVQQPCGTLHAMGAAITERYYPGAAPCFPPRATHAYPSCPPA